MFYSSLQFKQHMSLITVSIMYFVKFFQGSLYMTVPEKFPPFEIVLSVSQTNVTNGTDQFTCFEVCSPLIVSISTIVEP